MGAEYEPEAILLLFAIFAVLFLFIKVIEFFGLVESEEEKKKKE